MARFCPECKAELFTKDASLDTCYCGWKGNLERLPTPKKMEDGGPAFPVEMPREIAAAEYKDGVITATVRGHPGMTLRDYYVGQAMPGISAAWIRHLLQASEKSGGVPNHDDWDAIETAIVQHAERIADEYLRRRAERAKGDKS